jgi:hypothetical protein
MSSSSESTCCCCCKTDPDPLCQLIQLIEAEVVQQQVVVENIRPTPVTPGDIDTISIADLRTPDSDSTVTFEYTYDIDVNTPNEDLNFSSNFIK